MGEASKKRRAHHALLQPGTTCVYCGSHEALTVEHMPPKMMFRNKHRLQGLEFACCSGCNSGTKADDQIASLLGRAVADHDLNDQDREDIMKMHSGVANNFPEIIVELQGRRSNRKDRQILRRLGSPPGFGGVWDVDGPLVNQHMLRFSAKLGFALHC